MVIIVKKYVSKQGILMALKVLFYRFSLEAYIEDWIITIMLIQTRYEYYCNELVLFQQRSGAIIARK